MSDKQSDQKPNGFCSDFVRFEPKKQVLIRGWNEVSALSRRIYFLEHPMTELRQPRHNRNAFVATTDATRPDWECDRLGNGRSFSRDWAAEQIAVVRRCMSQRRALADPTVVVREAADVTATDSPHRRANIEDRYEEAERWDGMA